MPMVYIRQPHLVTLPEVGEGSEAQPQTHGLHPHPLVVGQDGAHGHPRHARGRLHPSQQPRQESSQEPSQVSSQESSEP